MNHDVGMIATPANARRLMRLSTLFSIEITREIEELATQDAVTFEDFDSFSCPHTETREIITQFLLDSDMRGCVFPFYHPEMTKTALLHAIKLSNPSSVIICCDNPWVSWRNALQTAHLQDITTITSLENFNSDNIDQLKEDGILIIDELAARTRIPSTRRFKNIFYDLSKVIVYDRDVGENPFSHWIGWTSIIHPTMPHPATIRCVEGNPPEWKKLLLADFAPLYGMCIFPELINDVQKRRTLSDKAAQKFIYEHENIDILY